MSLHRIRSLYCLMMISIAIILTWTGIFVCWIAAVALLAGALPMLKVLGRENALSALRGLPPEVEHHNQSTDQSFGD